MSKAPIPIELYIDNNRHKKSPAFIQAKKEAQEAMMLGTKMFSLPPILKDDLIAMGKWIELVELYEGYSYVTTADTEIMAQYCLCYSELCSIIHSKRETIKYLESEGSTDFKITQVCGNMNFDSDINTKRDKLSRLSDKLFLTPTSRIKAIVQPKQEKKDPLSEAGFGSI